MIFLIILCLLFEASECIQRCTTVDPYCSCDNECYLYGDCCPGHNHYDNKAILRDVLTCKEMYSFRKEWIVDKCPKKNHRYADYCTKGFKNRLQYRIPVISDNRVTYANEFCARCNSVVKYQYHNVTVQCTGPEPQSAQEKRQFFNDPIRCSIQSVTKNQFRQCDDTLVRKCPTSYRDRSLSEYCAAGEYETMTNGGLIYRNMNCCICWNVTCLPLVSDGFYQPPIRGDEFTYLLNFNDWDKEQGEIEFENKGNSTSTFNITNTTTSTIENVVYYSSYILSILSILSAILLTIIYATNSVFRNFGGYLTICLSVCLILMNLLNLVLANVAISSASFCTCIGILQHFIALSNFIWMAIYALDLLQTFGLRSSSRSKRKSFKTFLVYCGVGFGIATLVVGGATISEYILDLNSTIRPEYGGRRCWFTSKYGGIVWYFVPVSILVAWNFVACVVVFYKLSQTTKECRAATGKESNKTFWLCVRLTAVFGLGYLVQILAVLSGVRGLIVAGSLVNCSQGCLLAACFVWTKKVRNVVTTNVTSITSLTSRMKSDNSKSQTTDLG